jgi:hypothetical protein
VPRVSWFTSQVDARRKNRDSRKEYNQERPHSSLVYRGQQDLSSKQKNRAMFVRSTEWNKRAGHGFSRQLKDTQHRNFCAEPLCQRLVIVGSPSLTTIVAILDNLMAITLKFQTADFYQDNHEFVSLPNQIYPHLKDN